MAHSGTVMRIKCHLAPIESLALSQTDSTDGKKTSDWPVGFECDRQMFVIFQGFFWKGLFFPTLLYGVFPRWNRWNKFTREASHRGCEVTQLSSLVMSSLLLLRTDFVVEFTRSAPLLMSSPPDLLRCQSSPCWIWVSLYFWPTLSGLEKKKNNRRLSVDVHTSDCAENFVDVNQKPIYNQ